MSLVSPAALIPPRNDLKICFAHAAYRLGERFALRKTGLDFTEVRDREALAKLLPETDVLVVSGLWHNDLLNFAPKLKFIQSISSGTDQFGRDVLRAKGIKLASAAGVNAQAVAEHALALMLALSRRIAEARDHQTAHHWRGMIGDLAQREDELCGKTVLVVGMGRIGGKIAALAKAFGMRVIGIRQDPASGTNGADEIYGMDECARLAHRADYVVLSCALTPQTEGLLSQAVLEAMKPSAYLVNVARGKVVDEHALIASLKAGQIAGAALDVVVEEPMPATAALWDIPNVLITPHSAGETRAYEDNVLDILTDNLERLWRGKTELQNGLL
jgi:D-2-hydroxyacid dehydrogenase (NADP+)